MFRAPACSSPDPGHVRSEAIQSVGTERLLVASGDNLIVVTEALKRPPQLVVVDMPPAVVIQPTDILANQPVGGSRLFSRKIATVMPLGADKDLHTASNDGLAARGQSQQTNDNSTLKESQRKQQRQTTGEDIGQYLARTQASSRPAPYPGFLPTLQGNTNMAPPVAPTILPAILALERQQLQSLQQREQLIALQELQQFPDIRGINPLLLLEMEQRARQADNDILARHFALSSSAPNLMARQLGTNTLTSPLFGALLAQPPASFLSLQNQAARAAELHVAVAARSQATMSDASELNGLQEKGNLTTRLIERYSAGGTKEPPFPLKLHAILDNPEYHDVITWLPHGKSWRILKPSVFEKTVIPKFFRHAKYASFMRQVNGWGFKRTVHGIEHNSYYHEFFVRNNPALCMKMKRIGAAKNAAGELEKSSVSGDELTGDNCESDTGADDVPGRSVK